MTRSEYIAELESHLISLSKEERDMAINFYEEYFDEAGPENEQDVIADLGKPFSLARSIIGETSAYSKSMVYLKYKESKPMPQNNTSVFASLRKPDAFDNAETIENPEPVIIDMTEDIMPNGAPAPTQNVVEEDVFPTPDKNAGMFDDDYIKNDTTDIPKVEPSKKSSNTALIIILIVFGVILGFPIICSLAGFLIAVIAAMFAVGLAAAACILSSIIVFISGLILLPTSIANGLGYIFASILVSGFGMMLLSAALAFFFKLIPFTVKGIAKLFSKRRKA